MWSNLDDIKKTSVLRIYIKRYIKLSTSIHNKTFLTTILIRAVFFPLSYKQYEINDIL